MEKFFRVIASAELDYDNCYHDNDLPDVEEKLEVQQYNDPIEMMRVMLKESPARYETLLEEMGYIKKSKLDKTQKLGLEAKYVVLRKSTIYSYSEKVKIVDLDDAQFAHVFSCYDNKEVFELYQKVKMITLKKIHPKAYKAYEKMKKEVATAKKKRKMAAVKSKATEVKKALDKARKLIAEEEK